MIHGASSGVLYVAEQRLACFIETLYRFRRPLDALEGERAVRSSAALPPPRAVLPLGWIRGRGFRKLELDAGRSWLDLRTLTTREVLRPIFATVLTRLGLTELDLGALYGPQRALTQQIARWAYDRGYAGLRYGSRYVEELHCWAIFERQERASFRPRDPVEVIAPDDPDLLAAMELFGLAIP